MILAQCCWLSGYKEFLSGSKLNYIMVMYEIFFLNLMPNIAMRMERIWRKPEHTDIRGKNNPGLKVLKSHSFFKGVKSKPRCWSAESQTLRCKFERVALLIHDRGHDVQASRRYSWPPLCPTYSFVLISKNYAFVFQKCSSLIQTKLCPVRLSY